MGISGRDIRVKGRDATGRKSEIPWVRVFSASRSANAHEGWYFVYLFPGSGDGFFLALVHGSTRWENGEFKPRSADELGRKVSWASSVLADQLESHSQLFQPMRLHARTELGPAYALGTVVATYYAAHAVPNEDTLAAHLKLYGELLGKLYEAEDLGYSMDSRSREAQLVQAVVESLGAPTSKKGNRGQWFGLSPTERRVVEAHAMQMAASVFSAAGWEVEDVSSKFPYDLLIRKDDIKSIVEVKGTTGLPESIILTANEVAAHRKHFPHNVLFVLHSIRLSRSSDPPVASGGVVMLVEKWIIEDSSLSPLCFQYALDKE